MPAAYQASGSATGKRTGCLPGKVDETVSLGLCSLTVHIHRSDQDNGKRTIFCSFMREMPEVDHGICGEEHPEISAEKIDLPVRVPS